MGQVMRKLQSVVLLVSLQGKTGRFLKPFTGQGQGICARNGIPGLRTRELSSLEGCGSSRERTFRSQKIMFFG